MPIAGVYDPPDWEGEESDTEFFRVADRRRRVEHFCRPRGVAPRGVEDR